MKRRWSSAETFGNVGSACGRPSTGPDFGSMLKANTWAIKDSFTLVHTVASISSQRTPTRLTSPDLKGNVKMLFKNTT